MKRRVPLKAEFITGGIISTREGNCQTVDGNYDYSGATMMNVGGTQNNGPKEQDL